jgi:branched-chain amino acid transport system substrate-binding protein
VTRRLTRRTVICGAAGSALAASLSLPAIAEANPIKIGLLTIKTGPLASAGIQMEQGTVLFLKEREHTLAGRKAELVVADSGGNPTGAKTKAQELIERDGVDMIFGPLAAFEVLAISAITSPGKRSCCWGSRRPRT